MAETADADLPPYLRAALRPDAGGDDDAPAAFAGGRVGTRPQPCVTFRTAAGTGLTLAYHHLYAITDDGPEGGFVLEFTKHTVRVAGRNLGRLHRLLGDCRVREVRAADELHARLVPDGEPVVTGLDIRAKRPDEC